MKQMFMVIIAFACLTSSASAEELLPWEIEYVFIATPGTHLLKIDDRELAFDVPIDLPTKSFRAAEVITRGEKFDDWLKSKGEYEKKGFGESWNFYPLGIPFFGSYAQFSILAKVYIKSAASVREHPVFSFDRGDFSKPDELEAKLQRYSEKYRRYIITPVDEVIINGRKWYRYLESPSSLGDPSDLREYYVTGLAPDRYLEVKIRMHPVPASPDGYPRYASEDQQPAWMKKAVKYKEQVINSIHITKPAGGNEPDLYMVDAVPPPPEESSGGVPN